MTRLTLCAIVRDEERWLDGCLASVAGIVDAVVVVDTGSTDRTLEIARAHGATVVRHAWNDDFAAARNAALEAVADGYVLVLDADERLAPGAGPALLAAVETGDLDCGELPLHNADRVEAEPADVLSGARRLGDPVRLGRLLRRTPDLAWEGRVHEHVTAWSERHPARGPVEAAIVHYGAVPELRRELGKDARNLRLLERRRVDDPGSVSAAAYLAQEQARAGQGDAARASAAEAWALARRAGVAAGLAHAGTIHALLELEAGAHDASQAVLDELARADVRHPNLDYLAGRAAEARARAARDAARADDELRLAAEGYARALRGAGRTHALETLNGITGPESELRLGLCLLQRGDAESALERFDAVLAARSDTPAARLGRVEALIAGGRTAEALDEVQPLLHPKLPDGWLLGAWAAAACGDGVTAGALLARVDGALEDGRWLAPHRGRLAAELADLLVAA